MVQLPHGFSPGTVHPDSCLRCGKYPAHPYHGSTWPFTVLHEPESGKMPKFFFVDERWKHGPDGSNLFTYWYIHNGTVSLDSLHRDVARHQQNNQQFHRKHPLRFQVFQAKNRTQIVEFLRERGEPTNFMNTIHPHPLIEESQMPTRPGRSEFLLRRIEQMEAELEYIEELPTEPVMDDEASVVWWQARWPNGTQIYTYAAVRTEDGLWYTTGPRTPKGYSWDDLIAWIDKEARPYDGHLWVATAWDPEVLP